MFALFLAIAAVMAYNFVDYRLSLTGPYERATPDMLRTGRASVPFQYRFLVPWLVDQLCRLDLPVIGSESGRVFAVVEFISTFALVVAFRAYLARFVTGQILTSMLALSLLWVLPYAFVLPRALPLRYPSDVPSVLFSVLGLLFLHDRRLWLYYLTFAIGTINRETTCFLTMAFLLTEWGRCPGKSLARHVVAQVACWSAVKAWLTWLFATNPGQGLWEWSVAGNLRALQLPIVYPYLLSSLGYAWLPALLLYRHIESGFLRRVLWAGLMACGSLLLVGNIVELRIFGELTAFVLPATLTVLVSVCRNPQAADRAQLPVS